MTKLPSLNKFLEEIDFKKTLDRKKAAAEISVIILLQAIKEAMGELKSEEQDKIKKILGEEEKIDFDKVYDLFEKSGKQKNLIDAINSNSKKVRKEYIKTHLETLAPEEKEKLLSKFPELRKVTEEK